jgi:hypothetical protein
LFGELEGAFGLGAVGEEAAGVASPGGSVGTAADQTGNLVYELLTGARTPGQ